MAISQDHQFSIGESFENRKGLYEVIAVDGDSITIRWDTGEEIKTSAKLQAKILRNMDADSRVVVAQRRHRLSKGGGLFTGLQATDFSHDVTGTHWRCRDQLGGAVTQVLNADEPFNSWSIYKRAQVHWAIDGRYRNAKSQYQAKFLVSVNPDHLLYGLYVERSDRPVDNREDWDSFVAWTDSPNHCRWLHRVLLETGATIHSPWVADPEFFGSVEPASDERFVRNTDPSTYFDAVALPGVLRAIPDDRWLDLIVGRIMPRDEAVDLHASLAITIGDFFNRLMPVYLNKPPF